MNEQKSSHNLIEYILALSKNDFDATTCANCLGDNHEVDSDAYLQAMRTAEEVIKFMDEMPGGFLIYHADGDEEIIYANKALLRIFKCKTMEEFRRLTNNSFKGLVYHEDLESVEKSIKEQIANSKYDLDYVEYRVICKDGSIRWIEDYGHFVRIDSIGDIFYVFLGDATEKIRRLKIEKAAILNEKREQELLLEKYNKELKLINQEHLRRLEVIKGLSINYESILYVDLDADKVLPYRVNHRTKGLFECGSPCGFLKYAASYIDRWVLPEDRDIVLKATSPDYIKEKLSDSKTFYINYRIINDKHAQYLQLRIVNVGDGDSISQIVLGYRSVDEEILREMQQKQILEEALNKATMANIAQNTFLSNMSHDMRTPLNAIFGYTALARKYLDDLSSLEGYLDKIDASSEQLLDLIDKVLELSWMESKDMSISESECNLESIVQEVYGTVSYKASEKNILLSVDTSSLKNKDIYSDPDKLRQLMLHLVNNAIAYTKSGGKVDIIVSELKKLPNDYAVYQLTVKDNGIGISEEFLERIFEPFERENNTTQSGVHGMGLGLTIVKNIVDMIGGEIKVASTLGKGSTFTIVARMRIQQNPVINSGNIDDIILRLMDKRILLVEDNEINLEVETVILQGLGLIIDAAKNGSIAVEKIRNSANGYYSLVLMDIQMPVMDGIQATREIRMLDNPVLSNIPIIALSANALESDKLMSIECGMDAHLAKPIDVTKLLETIAKILAAHNTLN